ncbi:MAG: ABC transporter substrate-binding protein [Elusimicrobia bacterium]|nr:ABC transporter substrate-binding protein [Elusimicrobiota bacterium]
MSLLLAILSFAAAWAPPASCQTVSTPTAPSQTVSTAPATSQVSTPTATTEAQPTDAGPKGVREAVEGAINSMLAVLQDKSNSHDARRQKLLATMDSVGDFALMAKLTLGPVYWPKFDEAQRKEFVATFTKTIHDACFDKLDTYTDETVEFVAPVPGDKGKYAMTLHILSKGERYVLTFKLYRAKTTWKMYDIDISGVSFIRAYMAQYDQVLQKASPRELLDKMGAKSLVTPKALKDIKEPSKAGQEGPR